MHPLKVLLKNRQRAISYHLTELRIGQDIADKLDDEAAITTVERIAVYSRDAKKGERLGKMVDRTGTGPFKGALAWRLALFH